MNFEIDNGIRIKLQLGKLRRHPTLEALYFLVLFSVSVKIR